MADTHEILLGDLAARIAAGETVLLADIADFGAMNEVYAQFFAEPYPARAAFQAAALPKGARVEIKATAVI